MQQKQLINLIIADVIHKFSTKNKPAWNTYN